MTASEQPSTSSEDGADFKQSDSSRSEFGDPELENLGSDESGASFTKPSKAKSGKAKSSKDKSSKAKSDRAKFENINSLDLPIIGWREKVALPDLAIASVKAKVDTGARSSALHAFDIELFEKDGVDFVRFKVHPVQRSRKKVVTAEAALLDTREVRSSSGKAESRPVISTMVSLGGRLWPIELTLTDRDQMGFRMLLGRQGIRHRFLVDPGKSYVQSSLPAHKLKSRKQSSKSRKKLDENSNLVEKFLSLFDSSA